MDFSSILSKSWQDYKKNFKLVLKTYWWFNILPFIIFGIIVLSLFLTIATSLKSSGAGNLNIIANLTSNLNTPTSLTGNVVSNFLTQPLASLGGIFVGFIVAFIIYVIVVFILSIFLYLTLYYSSFYNEKGNLTFREAAKGGIHYFWRFLGLGILIFLIMILLFLPGILSIFVDVIFWKFLSLALKVILVLFSIVLFILAIIFSIYLGVCWFFSAYVLIRENTKIVEAMKRSKLIVKGKWWKVFGYFLLIVLIMVGINLAFSIPSWIIGFILTLLSAGLMYISLPAYIFVLVIKEAISFVFSVATTIITVPLSIFFFKNFYLEMRKGVWKNLRK